MPHNTEMIGNNRERNFGFPWKLKQYNFYVLPTCTLYMRKHVDSRLKAECRLASSLPVSKFPTSLPTSKLNKKWEIQTFHFDVKQLVIQIYHRLSFDNDLIVLWHSFTTEVVSQLHVYFSWR